jgi:hypothetical protein
MVIGPSASLREVGQEKERGPYSALLKARALPQTILTAERAEVVFKAKGANDDQRNELATSCASASRPAKSLNPRRAGSRGRRRALAACSREASAATAATINIFSASRRS